MATEQETREIIAAMDEWTSASAAKNSHRQKSLWDQQYPNVVYIAEENELPIVGWAGIADYYGDDDGESADRFWTYTYDNLVLDVFGDTAYAQCTAIGQVGRSPRTEYVMRITFIFRKVEGQWKIIHFHESANPTVGPDGHVID